MITDASSSAPNDIPPDTLARYAPREDQAEAARMAQDGFSAAFRLTVSEDDAARIQGVTRLAETMQQWVAEANDEQGRNLRMAMLVLGLDQWGVAYSRAFELQAIPGLTELVGALRTSLGPRDEAHFQRFFEAIDRDEGNAIDFKIELRRSIHLALWHAMIACEQADQANAILSPLGSMMCGLVKLMPTLGWRLVADAVANIQIQCVANGLATEGLARESTEALFDAISQALPKPQRDLIMAHAAKSVIAWQQASRASSDQVH